MILWCPVSVVCIVLSISGALLSLMSCDILFLWLSLEMSSLGFIGFVATSEASVVSSEGLVKYYLPSVSSNLGFFMMVVLGKGSGLEMYEYAAILPLMVKLGVAPVHFWVPNLCKSLSWAGLVFLLSVQKLGPLHGLVWGAPLGSLFVWWGVVSALWGGIGGMNMTEVKGVLAYSSISAVGWLLASSSVNGLVPYVGWGLYSFTLVGLGMSMIGNSLYGFGSDPVVVMFVAMMAGFPGGSMFCLKWLVLSSMILEGLILPSFVLVLASVITLPMYIGIVFSSFVHFHWRMDVSRGSGKWLLASLIFSYYLVGYFV